MTFNHKRDSRARAPRCSASFILVLSGTARKSNVRPIHSVYGEVSNFDRGIEPLNMSNTCSLLLKQQISLTMMDIALERALEEEGVYRDEILIHDSSEILKP